MSPSRGPSRPRRCRARRCAPAAVALVLLALGIAAGAAVHQRADGAPEAGACAAHGPGAWCAFPGEDGGLSGP